MKKLNFLLLIFFSGIMLKSNSQQIFPTPSGIHGELSDKTKDISYSYLPYCQSSVITNLKEKKESSKNRRFTFTANFSPSSWSPPELECGYNKLGRLSFKDNDKGGWNKYKLHVGWRSATEPTKLLFSIYFHDQDDVNWAWNKFAEGYVNTDIRVDMFLGIDVLALIIDNNCIGIRYKGYFPDENGESALARTFFFGGSCCPFYPFMTVDYSNQLYDYDGFETNFNNQDYMTWNLSEFEPGDLDKFYAKKVVHGSIEDPSDVNSKVPIEEQKCVIKAGADITFGSEEKVILHPGFHAKPGSHFVAAICHKIAILSTPENYTSYQCYNVLSAISANAKLYYKDWIAVDWTYIGSVTGTFSGSQICFDFDDESVLPPIGQYRVEATFTNKCMDMTSTIDYDVLNNAETFSLDSLSKKQLLDNLKDNVLIDKGEEVVVENVVNPHTIIVIFPNPNSGIFTIQFLGNFKIPYSVGIADLMGNSIYQNQNISKNSFDVDISNYPKGIYFVKVQAGDKIFTEKIVYR